VSKCRKQNAESKMSTKEMSIDAKVECKMSTETLSTSNIPTWEKCRNFYSNTEWRRAVPSYISFDFYTISVHDGEGESPSHLHPRTHPHPHPHFSLLTPHSHPAPFTLSSTSTFYFLTICLSTFSSVDILLSTFCYFPLVCCNIHLILQQLFNCYYVSL
jgi:hypothetical protein